MQSATLESALSTEPVVESMSVKCPCGNWVFIGVAGRLRRATDIRLWTNLKCPTCAEAFSANYADFERIAVPIVLFERGFCTPDAMLQS